MHVPVQAAYSGPMPELTVDVWSDVVCPWCYLGRGRLVAALAAFEHAGDVRVRWHAFELDPDAPRISGTSSAERLAARYGRTVEQAQGMHAEMEARAAAEGLRMDFARARDGNTFDAHRLIAWAQDQGAGDAMCERLMTAYFAEGEAIGDPDVLARLAGDAGLDAAAAAAMLDGTDWAGEVRDDERRAAELGIRGVPFFVLGDRFGLSGAQSAELLERVLRRAWDASARAPA